MERSKRDRLEDLRRTTTALVEIPSFYSPEHHGDEAAIQQCIEGMLRSAPDDIRIEKQIVGGERSRRENIIAMRGAPIEGARFVVLLVCHTDTVRKKPGWSNGYALVEDGDLWRGVGVYDMKAGVAINVDFMQHGKIPDGVCVVAAFVVGEEGPLSDGAHAFCEWQHFGKIGLIIPTEIASLLGGGEKDFPKDVAIGRRGCYKSHLTITTSPAHGYKTHLPDSGDAWAEMRNILKEQFQSQHHVRSLLGEEFLRFRKVKWGEDEDSLADEAHSLFEIRLVDRSVDEIRQWLNELLTREIERLGWEGPDVLPKHVIHAQNNDRDMAQYEPFLVPASLPLMQLCNRETRHFYNEHVREGTQVRFIGASGHSDENIYYARLLKLRGELVPMWHIHSCGGSEHSPNEYVRVDSVVNASGCIEHLIGNAVPAHLAGERQLQPERELPQ